MCPMGVDDLRHINNKRPYGLLCYGVLCRCIYTHLLMTSSRVDSRGMGSEVISFKCSNCDRVMVYSTISPAGLFSVTELSTSTCICVQSNGIILFFCVGLFIYNYSDVFVFSCCSNIFLNISDIISSVRFKHFLPLVISMKSSTVRI